MKRRKGLLDEEKFLPPLPEQLPRGVSSLPGYGQTSPVAQGLLGFTGRNPTYSVMDPQAQQMSDAYRLGEQASVASQLYGSVLPFAAASTMASAQRAGSLLSPLTVFHGSPHKFSKFDASKIGTGEGAQAYGHGLYFAESPAVAKGYQTSTSKDKFITGSGYFDPSDLEHINVKATLRKSGLDEAIATARKYGVPDEDYPDVAAKAARDLKKLEAIKASGGLKVNEGSLYTVDLPDEQIAKMLDWDKPLSQQKDIVKNITPESLGLTYTQLPNGNYAFVNQEGKILGNLQKGGTQEGFTKNWMSDVMRGTGQDLYKMLGQGMEKSPAVSSALREAGIPGIRYLDQGSRGKGGTSNFVVFPGEESKLRIMEVNGKPVVIDEEELRRSGLLGVAQ